MRREGIILKSLSGFYEVSDGNDTVTCKARGKFRYQKLTPLVGDRVIFSREDNGLGMLEEILPRKNEFQRPAVCNIEQLVIVASGAIPVTDPFLIDRMTAIAEYKGCESIICINKWDLNCAEELYSIYDRAGFTTLQVSAETGEGIDELLAVITGKISAFTGNSGVGKSSILNAMRPGFTLEVGQVSEKLGRGRHTTRHVELYPVRTDTLVADTPGFSSFDAEEMETIPKEQLQFVFREFKPYLDQCRYTGCSHLREKGCAVLEALAEGKIHRSRHQSYVRLCEQAGERKSWDAK